MTEYDSGADYTVDYITFDGTATFGGGGPGPGPGPGGSTFSSRSGISGASGRVTGSNVGASKEFGEPSHAGNRGGASLWWSWTAPATGTVTFDTQGSDFDTLLAVYTGSSVGALTEVDSDDDTIGRQSEVSFVAQQGVVYHIAVDGYSGVTGSIVLNWSQVGGGPGPGPGLGGSTFSLRSGISGASGVVTGSNAGASKEFGEPNHAGNRGGASLWWSWTAPATGTVTIDTQGSDFDTLLAVYTGSSVGGLTRVASDDDTIGRQSQVSFVAQQGVVYHIAVDGYSGATGSIVLNWSQVGGGPGPGPGLGGSTFSSRSGISGASGRVTGSNVGASKEFGEPSHAGNRGGASLWWSWTAPVTGTVTFDTQGSDFDTLLAVYTGSSVGALAAVASDDDTIGRQSEVSFVAQQGVVYHIAVDGYSGATGSIVLNWSQAGGPGPGPGPGGAGGDSFVSRSSISGASGRETESNVGASKEFGEPSHAGNRGGASLWWSWTAPVTGTVTIDTQGSDFDTLLAVYTGSSVGALTVVASDDDTIGRQSEVSFVAQQGVVYHIAVDGYSGATGSIVLNWSQAGAPGPGPGPGGAGGDSFVSRSSISGASGRETESNAGASKEFGEPNHAGNAGGASLWWSWTAPATGTVTIDTQGSDFDTLLAVYTGSSVGALTVVASDDDTIGRQSEVSFVAQQGVVYHIAVDGYSGAAGSIVLNWSQAASGSETTTTPSVTQQFADNVVVMRIPGSLATDPFDVDQFRELSRAFYGKYQDAFDFLIFISNLPEYEDNESVSYYGIHIRIRNAVEGTGLPVGTYRTQTGSTDRLKGILHFPYFGGLTNGPSLHEILHSWANYVLPTTIRSHWGFSSANGQLGGFDLANLVEHGGGKYSAGDFGTNANGGNSLPYSPIELYLAGLIPPSQVPDLWVAKDGARTNERDESGNLIFTALDVETYSIERIVRENGARVPDYRNSQRAFRAAAILLVDETHPATRMALQELSDAVQDFSHPGSDENRFSYNFWEATGGRATLTMNGLVQRSMVGSSPSTGDLYTIMDPNGHEESEDIGIGRSEEHRWMTLPETHGIVDLGEGDVSPP